jgi:hypothetical protein
VGRNSRTKPCAEQLSLQNDLSTHNLVCWQAADHGFPGKLLTAGRAFQVFVGVVNRDSFVPTLDQLPISILVVLHTVLLELKSCIS